MLEDQQSDYRLTVSARRARELAVPSLQQEADRPAVSLLTVLWRRRFTVAGCILAALIAGMVYLVKATPIYSSSSVVYVQQAVPKIISDEISNGASSAGYLYTQCQLIQSTAILSAALEVPGVADAKCLKGIDNPIAFLKSAVTALPSKQGELINVTMESTQPQDAAIIVNGVVESYIDYQSKQHKSTAVEVMRILQKEMDRHEKDLTAQQQSILELKKQNPELSFQTDKGSLAMTHFMEISEALSQAELRALDLKTAVEEARGSREDIGKLRRFINQFQLADAAALNLDPQMLVEFDQEQNHLDELTDKFGPKNDLVLQSQRKINRLQSKLFEARQETASTYFAVLQEALDDANARVTQLQKALSDERQLALKLNIKQVEYEQMVQEAQRTERALDLLDSRMKEVNVSEDVGSLTVSVLETAKPEWAPVRPKRAQTLSIALVAGIMVGLGGALLRDMMDQRLRSAEEISRALELPILGGVPHIVGKALPAERGQEVMLKPRSDVAEAYRTIRTAIYFGLSEVKAAKTILVTSPAPGDGKSTSISNLAIAVAQAGRRVLLIDADCRRPVQHKTFGLKTDHGLSSVLSGESTLAQAIQKTTIDKLEILPCGPLPHNPAELLNSQGFLDVLKEVSAQYDQILIDSPPVVPVTDARILAASCDATVLVLRAERSTRSLAEHARSALVSVGANLLGLVVNDVPRGKEGYGYYYYGYGRYSYGSNGSSTNGNGNGNGKKLAATPLIVAQEVTDD